VRSLRGVPLAFRGFGDIYAKANYCYVNIIFVRIGGIFVGNRASG
jgi:hypothetical protein